MDFFASSRPPPPRPTVAAYVTETVTQVAGFRERWQDPARMSTLSKVAATAIIGRLVSNHVFPTKLATQASRGRQPFVTVAQQAGKNTLAPTGRLKALLSQVLAAQPSPSS